MLFNRPLFPAAQTTKIRAFHACSIAWQWNNPYNYYAPGTWTIEGYGAAIHDTWTTDGPWYGADNSVAF